MVADARGHNVPAAGDTPRRQTLLDLALSINDFVSVANTTDRAQKLADIGASAARPLLVYRQDVGRFEWTIGGTTPVWRDLLSRKDGQSPYMKVTQTVATQRSGGGWFYALPNGAAVTGAAAGDQPWTFANGLLTINEAGLYHLDSLITGPDAGFGTDISNMNNASNPETLAVGYPGTVGSRSVSSASVTTRLAVGDQIAVRFYAGTAKTLPAHSAANPQMLLVTRESL